MSAAATFSARRDALETYFDRTARDAWERLTSDAPVSGIRATVRAGRDAMRATIMGWLPEDMTGLRLLDAGCGTGALAVEAAARGAEVVAIDVAKGLVDVARQRALPQLNIEWHAGDMLSPDLGVFDHIVAMDSLIHYRTPDVVAAVAALQARAHRSVIFTVAPRTPALTVMHSVGLLFPRGDRAPAIVPVAQTHILSALGPAARRHKRISSGFYKSQAFEVSGMGHAG